MSRRSDNAGESWTRCFTPGENVEPGWVALDLSWGFGGPAQGFHVCSSNPDTAMFTNNGELFITRNGGQSWQPAYSRRVVAQEEHRRSEPWTSCGLEVTTCWQFALDPHDSRRAYIC